MSEGVRENGDYLKINEPKKTRRMSGVDFL